MGLTAKDAKGIHEKYEDLRAMLRSMGSVAVAFSSGVDSTFLLWTAHDVLGDNAMAVTARSHAFPGRELAEATAFCLEHGIRHAIIDSEELDIDGFADNPANRCYLCKSELFTKIGQVAKENGMATVADGSNTDDVGDYRPGLIAIRELGVASPLRAAGFSKQEIRDKSRELGLATWDKQSFACLSSRLPYGEKITTEKLDAIDKAEQYLIDRGFRQIRVRHHGDLARIETDEAGFALLADPAARREIHAAFKALGFTYIAMDLLGYRTGSMNETLGLKASV